MTMKKNFIICALLMTAMILSPLAALGGNTELQKTGKSDENGVVSVMLSENGKVEKLDEREYVIGALAAEADMSCHDEALKAQAVACYTYMLYMKSQDSADSFNGADVSDDSEACQGYISLSQRKEKWGDKFDENEKKTEKIVDSVLGKTIQFDGEPVMAVYHQLNSGETENASDVWGKDIPYLQSVESAGDRLSTDYSKTVILSESEFMLRAIKLGQAGFDGDAEDWVKNISTANTGLVKKLEVGGLSVTGGDFRKAFGLESSNFTVCFENDKFTIRTLGSGHGVGMSQYGADYMARQGSSYTEILQHYYTNTDIL